MSNVRDKPQLGLSAEARRDLEYVQGKLVLRDLVDAYVSQLRLCRRKSSSRRRLLRSGRPVREFLALLSEVPASG